MSSQRKYQVFISSTYEDLRLERQAAISAILSYNNIPAGMEFFGAGSDTQWSTIQRWIDDSDIYMLILGGRYGSIEEKTGLGYVELEYDYAVSRGKPVFSCVISDKGLTDKLKEMGQGAFELDSRDKYLSFVKKAKGRMCSFFHDTTGVELAVFKALPEIILRGGLAGWIKADSIEQHELSSCRVLKDRSEFYSVCADLINGSDSIKDTTWGRSYQPGLVVPRSRQVYVEAKSAAVASGKSYIEIINEELGREYYINEAKQIRENNPTSGYLPLFISSVSPAVPMIDILIGDNTKMVMSQVDSWDDPFFLYSENSNMVRFFVDYFRKARVAAAPIK